MGVGVHGGHVFVGVLRGKGRESIDWSASEDVRRGAGDAEVVVDGNGTVHEDFVGRAGIREFIAAAVLCGVDQDDGAVQGDGKGAEAGFIGGAYASWRPFRSIRRKGALLFEVRCEAHVWQARKMADAGAGMGGGLAQVVSDEITEVVSDAQEGGCDGQDVLFVIGRVAVGAEGHCIVGAVGVCEHIVWDQVVVYSKVYERVSVC
jgi:hypothetical protein